MAAYQRSKRWLATLLLLTLCATWVPSAQAVTASRPSASEVLLDVAAHSPGLLIQIKTQDDLVSLNIDPFVEVKMSWALYSGSWILTTRTPVTSGRWTGRPWLAVGGHARYFYFAYEQPPDGNNTDFGDLGGVVGRADSEAIGKFGEDLTTIGLGIAQLGKGNKGVTAIGLGIAGIGLTLQGIALGEKIAKDIAAARTGHVDPNEPTGMPSAGGPAGSDPNGPTGQSPPGQDSNGNGNTPSGGVSGAGGDGGGDDGGDD